MLLSILISPILGSLWLLVNYDQSILSDSRISQNINETKVVREIRNTTLKIICFTYFLSVLFWGGFNEIEPNIQYVVTFSNIGIGLDQLSLNYVILTTLTIPVVLLASYNMPNTNARLYLVLILIFESLIIMVFMCQDLLIFYISFESVLIPLCLLTGIYGGSNKIQAVYLLFIYTLVGSLPILLSLIKLGIIYGTLHFDTLSLINIDADLSNHVLHIIWFGIFLGLAIKTPLVPFHLWLKTAHAEANTATSIILAGLVLKIATYGFLRILISIFPALSFHYSSIVIVLALISIIYTSFTSIRQTDFKQLIAYTSVSHIGLTVLGIFSNTLIGIEGAILLSLAHGLTSPALFYLLGSVVYNRYHTRVIRYYRGLSIYIPIFSLFFFLFTIANIGTPSTGNWVGEFYSIAGSFQQYPLLTFLGSTTIVLSSIYSIFIFNRISFGTWSSYLIPVKDITRLEFNVVLPLAIFVFVLGLYPYFILNTLHVGVSQLIFN